MAKSIGIDLGTTNTVAAIKKVRVEMIKNAEGEFVTPSCVTVKEKKQRFWNKGDKRDFVVGRHALDWIKQDPENTITAIKRLMGRSLGDPEVRALVDNGHKQYQITAHSQGAENSLAVILHNREYTPEQISSKILEKIKKDAEDALSDQVDHAVITVPAYFNDKQKHATRTAAALAGLKVRRLLPEPTAAAISFGVDSIDKDEAKTLLIFDFGGGTFDLSVLTISGGQFIEQGKGGNMWMGGEDIDAGIVDFVLDEIAHEYGIEDIRAFVNGQKKETRDRFWGEVKAAAEQAKIRLSDEAEAYIEILGILEDQDGDRVDVDVALTRSRFETLIAPIIESALGLTRKLLEDIHFTPDLIDKVLLVGGSSRIPAVIRAVENEFGKDNVLLHERPMLAIAEGAAILSHRLSDQVECPRCGKPVAQTDPRCSSCDFDMQAYIITEGIFDIVHSSAHDYYIQLENNEKYLLIEKNRPLPCEHTEIFSLVHKDQKLVHMKFFNIVNEKEESIGDLWLGLDEQGADSESIPRVEITIKIDENNLVSAGVRLKGVPNRELSQTLSRGKADEKLFLMLEEMIDKANAGQSDEYQIIDLTSRVLSIVKDIHQVIDKETGEVVGSVYRLAEMKIDKAKKMAEADMTCKPLIYYAEDALHHFGVLIPPEHRKKIQKKIDRLNEADQFGSCEENIAAYEDLDSALDDFPMFNLLMKIKKAGDKCARHEPGRADQFYTGVEQILQSAAAGDADRIKTTIERIFPEAKRILDRYDNQTAVLYKGVTR